MIIIGIDPGIKNLGYHVGYFNPESQENFLTLSHIAWGNVSLQCGVSKCSKISSEQLCTTLIKKFIPNHISKHFDRSQDYIIIIEKQKQTKLKLLGNTLWARYFGKVEMIHPVHFKKYNQ
ncbi:hypothetical protein ACTFIY_004584 [Dictyostelium cf. discoideum]